MKAFLDDNLEKRETEHSLMSGSHGVHGFLQIMSPGIDKAA